MAPQSVVFFHILSNMVKIRLHTENQLPRLPGSASKVPGWVATYPLKRFRYSSAVTTKEISQAIFFVYISSSWVEINFTEFQLPRLPGSRSANVQFNPIQGRGGGEPIFWVHISSC
jgi:hypothetical protein